MYLNRLPARGNTAKPLFFNNVMSTRGRLKANYLDFFDKVGNPMRTRGAVGVIFNEATP